MTNPRRMVATILLALGVAVGSPAASAAAPFVPQPDPGWVWPAEAPRVVRQFEAPAHEYGAGHRGIDLAITGAIRAPAAGVVAFSGAVAGRGILTIDHGGGLVTTFEPVASDLAAGSLVDRGQDVAALASGGHAAAGTLHFGVRLHGEYVNPLTLLGGVPRAILLPCC